LEDLPEDFRSGDVIGGAAGPIPALLAIEDLLLRGTDRAGVRPTRSWPSWGPGCWAGGRWRRLFPPGWRCRPGPVIFFIRRAL